MLGIHKTLIKYIVVLLIAGGAVFVLAIYPQIRKLQVLARDIEFRKKPLLVGRYPLEPMKLEQGATDLDVRRRDLMHKSHHTYKTVMGVLSEEVEQHNGVEQFTKPRVVSKLEFHNKFSILESDLGKEGIVLDPEILGMSKETNFERFYEGVSYITVIRTLVDMCRGHDLEIRGPIGPVEAEAPDGENTLPEERKTEDYPARITVLPVRRYSLVEEGPAYLVEFPVKLKVSGRLDNFCAFLLALTEEKEDSEEPPRFLPVESVELNKIGLEDVVHSDLVEGTVVASAFLIVEKMDKLAMPTETDTGPIKKPLGI